MKINFPNFAIWPELPYFLMPQVILYSLKYQYNTTTLWGIAAIKNVLKCTRDDNSFKEIRKTCLTKFSFIALDAFNIS